MPSAPFPPTPCSMRAARATYDVAICMYHDQALIPAKTLSFDDGVNVTLGLPFIRTSPDHGTAFGIAGKGVARARQPDCGAQDGGPRWPHNGRSAEWLQLMACRALRDVISKHGLDAKKSLGQNFLLDLNLTQKIARTAGPLEGMTVFEVGPGPGGLTRAILSLGAKKLIAIERDERCLPALAEISDHYPGRLEVIEGDALKVDFAALAPTDGPSCDHCQPAL